MRDWLKLIAYNLLVLLFLFGIFLFGYEYYLRSELTNGEKPSATVLVPIFEDSATLTWEHRRNFDFEYLGLDDSLNEYGHRDVSYPDAENRILLLGDSFVFGMNVASGETMSSRLQSKLSPNRWDVMNAGVIGYTIDQQLLYLKQNFEQLRPNVVVQTFFVGNDLTEQRRHLTERDENGYPIRVDDQEVFVTDKGYLGSRNKLLFNSLALSDLRKRWRSFYWQFKPYAGLTWSAFLDSDHPAYPNDMEDLWERYLADFTKMGKFLEQEGVPFLVMIMPMDVQVDKRYWSKYPNMIFAEKEFEAKLPQERFNDFCERLNFNCLDLLPEFRSRADLQLYFADTDPHLAKDGNQLAADLLFVKLRPILDQFNTDEDGKIESN